MPGAHSLLWVFKLILLIAAAVVAFRTMRDAWFLAITAAASIADSLVGYQIDLLPDEGARSAEPAAHPSPWHEPRVWLENAGVAAAVLVLLMISSSATDFTQRGLDRAISSNYPVNAINFLRRNPVAGPLYNNLNWGGFLTWYMPDYPFCVP